MKKLLKESEIEPLLNEIAVDQKINAFFVNNDINLKHQNKLREVIRHLVCKEISNDVFLSKALIFHLTAKEDLKKLINRLIVNAALENFQSIVDDVLKNPKLVLSAFNDFIESFELKLNDIEGKYKSINNELENAHVIIKKSKNENTKFHREFKIDFIIKNHPEIVNRIKQEADNCRNKGKISFRKLGRTLGISHHTAKSWCKKLSIPIQIPTLN